MGAFDISILTNQYNVISSPPNPSNSKFKNLFSAFDFWFQKCISTFMGAVRTIFSVCSNSNFKTPLQGDRRRSLLQECLIYIWDRKVACRKSDNRVTYTRPKQWKHQLACQRERTGKNEELQAISSCWGEEPVLSRDVDPDWLSNPKESALNTCTWEEH